MSKKVPVAPVSRRVVGPPSQQPASPPPSISAPTETLATAPAAEPRTSAATQPQPRAKKKGGRPKKPAEDKVQPVNLTLPRPVNEALDAFLGQLNDLSPADIPKSALVAFALHEVMSGSPEEVMQRLVQSRRAMRSKKG